MRTVEQGLEGIQSLRVTKAPLPQRRHHSLMRTTGSWRHGRPVCHIRLHEKYIKTHKVTLISKRNQQGCVEIHRRLIVYTLDEVVGEDLQQGGWE